MICTRREGQPAAQGLNFYPWSERAHSVGFVLRIGSWRWILRWAPRVKKFYCYTHVS